LSFKAVFDDKAQKWVSNRAPGEDRPTDIVLATNMLSVGVDVDRLGLMVVNGQPKGTAEYIQATSRVGRAFPGLVASVLTWARPRDLSHYESFEHYHSTFYQYVEAQSVTPFSPRALDRGLSGTMLAILRQSHDQLRGNDDAGKMDSSAHLEMKETAKKISLQAWEITEDPLRRKLTEKEINARADDWAKEAKVSGRILVYQKRNKGGTAYQFLQEPGSDSWKMWTTPMSMREVEPGVKLMMSEERSLNDPNWHAQVKRTQREDKE